jgi:RNA polymerase sigma-70 factor (ECF subfamily)
MGTAYDRGAGGAMMAKIEDVAPMRDENAFQRLVLTFTPKVRAMMLRQGADAETADDIAQETMLTVWRKSHLFVAEKGSIATWIYTIARNLRIDRARRHVVWLPYDDGYGEVASSEELVEERLVRQEEEASVLAALAVLPAEQRQIIHLAFIDGMSHSKIARKLQLPLGTVKSRVRLAYQKLRDTVEGE